jgi:putative hydrolase of the HAD superfamily
VPAGTNEARDAVAREVGVTLGVDPEEFAKLYRSTFDLRTRGLLGDLTDTFRDLAVRLGVSPRSAQLGHAVSIRLEFARNLLAPRITEPVLADLKSAGYRIGIITDCSIETPLSWESSWLRAYVDAVAFSCELGIRKPDPRIYLSATTSMNVRPEHCIFVGDGGSNELSGARSLGMKSIRVDEFTSPNADRNDEESNWDGDSIAFLSHLVREYVCKQG